MTKSICFVASTLPANFIKLKAEELGIKKVIVLSEPLWRSYLVLTETHPNVRVTLAPKSILFGNIFIFCTLLFARTTNTNIIFFHECCFPIFDLLVKLIKPRGMFFPQVTMSGYEEVPYKVFPKGNLTKLLYILKISELFIYYKSSAVGSEGCEFGVSIKRYPDSIVVYDQLFSRNLINTNVIEKEYERKVLFLMGKSKVIDKYQIQLYTQLFSVALLHGFECYIKDHPNPKFRLNLDADDVISIDPLLPVELLDDDFSLVVGTSSTGLLNFGNRAVSLINVIKEITPEDVIYLKDHFYKTDPLNSIRFVQDLTDFKNIISGIKA